MQPQVTRLDLHQTWAMAFPTEADLYVLIAPGLDLRLTRVMASLTEAGFNRTPLIFLSANIEKLGIVEFVIGSKVKSHQNLFEIGDFLSVEENKAVIRKFIDAYNNRNLNVFEELVSPDYVDRTHQQQGRDKFKQLFTLAFEGFPDWHETIQDIIAEGEWVGVKVTATGTHSGNWNLFGVPPPPTGNKVTLPMVFFFRVVGGRLVEGGELDDQLDLFNKLGFIQYTEKGKQLFPEEAK